MLPTVTKPVNKNWFIFAPATIPAIQWIQVARAKETRERLLCCYILRIFDQHDWFNKNDVLILPGVKHKICTNWYHWRAYLHNQAFSIIFIVALFSLEVARCTEVADCDCGPSWVKWTNIFQYSSGKTLLMASQLRVNMWWSLVLRASNSLLFLGLFFWCQYPEFRWNLEYLHMFHNRNTYLGMGQYLLIPFLGGWTSINPSYFDVNYRGTRFWHTATTTAMSSGHVGCVVGRAATSEPSSPPRRAMC